MRQAKVRVNLPTEVPLRHEAQIMVVGGGPGGIGAAVAAAREGRDVLLVEHYGFLGGMATMGEVNPFMPNHLKGETLDKGIYTEWVDRIDGYGGLVPGTRTFDPHAARLAAEDLCLEAGVRLLFHHRPVSVETVDGRITHIVLHSKSGLTAARAKVYIDSTGDGDLCAIAGCRYEYGGETTPHAQPMTLCFKVRLDPEVLAAEGVDVQEDPMWFRKEWGKRINEAFHRAKRDGRLDCPREDVLMFACRDPYCIHFNTTRVIRKRSIDGEELSEAELEARRQLRQLVDVMKADVPVFRNARLYSIAPQIGIRESRRICGRARVTRDDFCNASTFPDGITRVRYGIDVHSPDGAGTERAELPRTAWYEVPYGCLVPEAFHNLLVGSRCVSSDQGAHSSLRVMPPVVSIGQAAGTAAAIAMEQGVDVDKVDGVDVKKRLIQRGRNLAREGEVPVLDPADATQGSAKRS